MLNNEFATGFNKFGNHEFLVGITFHGKMINYHEFPFLLGITFHGKMINHHKFPFLVGITFTVK
jgi:hypothetical protein